MVIDVGALDTLGTDLSAVGAQFEDANAYSDRAAEHVGHPDLADRIRSFAHGWDDTRDKMTESIKALGEGASTLAQNWRDIDQAGADALTGENQ